MLLARAMACAGRYPEAVEAASKAEPYFRDPYFAYRFARLMSLVGNTKKSLEWFDLSLRSGFSDITAARNDPDLERLHKDRAAGFNELTRVRFNWKINWGVITTDDIVLENRSLFPITNLKLNVTVSSTGYTDWTRTLTCDSIPAGGSYTWKFSGAGITSRGSDADARARASLTCDQTN